MMRSRIIVFCLLQSILNQYLAVEEANLLLTGEVLRVDHGCVTEPGDMLNQWSLF